MSDVQPTPDDQGESTPASSPAKGTSPLRLVLLLLIFGVALAGLLYDYGIARPSLEKAHETIVGLLKGDIPDPNGDGTVTEDEVQEKLGREPSSTKQLTNGKIEVYTWRSGLPYRVYKLYVVYTGQKLPLLYSASTNEEPKGDKLPPVASAVKQLTPEELETYVGPQPSGASSGGAAKGKKRPSKGESGGARKPGGSLTEDAATPGSDDSKKGDDSMRKAVQKTPPVIVSAPDLKSEPPTKTEPPTTAEAKKEEAAKQPPMKEEAATVTPKTEETAKDPPKEAEAAKEVPKEEAPPKKKETPKKEAPKKEEPAKKGGDDPAKKEGSGT